MSYDVPHRAPWDWRVSLYTWTKSIAAGVYIVAMLLVLGGVINLDDVLWRLATPALALTFLGATGLLLIADLEHPLRFYLIFTRPQWRSWLVRGAFVIAGYSAVLLLHVALAVSGASNLLALGAAGLPLAIMTAVYTAYLFAQSKGRDLWHSRLLPAHLLVQAALAGAAALVPVAAWLAPEAVAPLLRGVAVTAAVHLLLTAAEATVGHRTAHAELAAREMTSGAFRGFFWSGAVAASAGVLAPWIGVPAALAALAGLVAYEHAYVQAGQAVALS
jgi:formate-dependent nitrite reductase membrane component NrfD